MKEINKMFMAVLALIIVVGVGYAEVSLSTETIKDYEEKEITEEKITYSQCQHANFSYYPCNPKIEYTTKIIKQPLNGKLLINDNIEINKPKHFCSVYNQTHVFCELAQFSDMNGRYDKGEEGIWININSLDEETKTRYYVLK